MDIGWFEAAFPYQSTSITNLIFSLVYNKSRTAEFQEFGNYRKDRKKTGQGTKNYEG
jgi:hypothetical protein